MNRERSLIFPIDLPGRGDVDPTDPDDPYEGPQRPNPNYDPNWRGWLARQLQGDKS